MTERKLATIRKIAEVKSIPDADKICAYRVDGWWVVDSVGKYQVDDLVVYLEVDSFVPHELAPFLSKGKEPRVYEGVKGERLRSVRLKKQISQGLLLPLEPTCANIESSLFEGLDVTLPLNILKWERPMNAQLAGMARGNFPALVPKTDQPRLQNSLNLLKDFSDHSWSVTEKLDGSSCTFYLDADDVFHVCSRNLDLKEDSVNSFWKIAHKFKIEDVMRRNFMQGLAIQGEMIGEGIQGNQYKSTLDFYVYDIYNTKTGEYILPIQLEATCQRINLKHVPIISTDFKFKEKDVDSMLLFAQGKSMLNNSNREGVVIKSNSIHDLSAKIISNSWLLKNE